MKRAFIVFVLAAACAPGANARPSLDIALATASPTAVVSAPVTATPSRTEGLPPPEPTSARPPGPSGVATPLPAPTGPVRNDGQKILVTFDPPQQWFFGEASASVATQITNYALSGISLAGSALKCTEMTLSGGVNVCVAAEIIPSTRLVGGVTYELKLRDQLLGTFTANGLLSGTPHVVSVKATQFDLTVTFDRPMLHAGDCGTQSWALGVPGTIEFVRANAQAFPAPAGAYTSSSAAYRDFLSAFVSAADISDDCTTVKLGSGWGAPTGSFDVTVDGVEDVYGNPVQQRTFTIDVVDEGAPKLMFAQLELQTAEKKVIRVAYSEAMDEEYVTDPERYYLNGKLVPASTLLECELANCAWVRLTFAPGLFTYGADNTLTIVGVRDMAGNTMDPDIVTSGTFQVR